MKNPKVTRASRALGVVFLLSATVACDQATKQFASQALSDGARRSYLNGLVELHYLENGGAFLGLGAGLDENARFWLFTVGVSAFLVTTFALLFVRSPKNPWETIGLALILGGGIGNLMDRVLHGGNVVDFMRVGFGGVETGVFNVADSAIMVGVCVLLLPVFANARPRE